MLSTLAQQTVANKKIQRNKYIIVPPPKEIDDWTILEARSRGVPHAVYFDTSNKLSFFLSRNTNGVSRSGFAGCDIPGYEEKFSKENFGWRRSGWNKFDENEFLNCEQVFKELQQYFNDLGIPSYILYIYGSEKGHVSVTVDKNLYENDDISLWVYTKDDCLMREQPKWFDKLV